jgi:septal ring factor EnvC (AmiA/AmiB activator)
MGGAGNPGPDPFTSLLGIVGDPKATAERIKKLQGATQEHDKALEALVTRQVEFDTREQKIKQDEKRIAKLETNLQNERDELKLRADALARAEKATKEYEGTLAVRNQAEQVSWNDRHAELVTRDNGLKDREVTLEKRAKELFARSKEIEDDRAKLTKLEQDLLAKQADLDTRFDTLKKLVS